MTLRAAGSGRRAGRRPSIRLGLAISSTRLTVIEIYLRPLPTGLRPGRSWHWTLTPPATDGTWPALADALAELRAELGPVRATVGIALLRPFGHTKAVTVPPLRSRELGALVTRNVRRYFAIGSEPALADARFLPDSRRRRSGETPRPALAVCAPERDVETISAIVAAAGFRVDTITTGPVALAEGIRALLPATGRGHVTVSTSSPDLAETMQLVGGTPVLVQAMLVKRQPADAPALTIARTGGSEDSHPSPVSTTELGDLDSVSIAAVGAARLGDDVPLLLPADVRRDRQRGVRRRTYQLVAAAAGSIVLAAGLHLWGLRRELHAIELERRAIAPAVARASASRRAAVNVLAQLETVARLERTSPRYTQALTALAEALPDSAYLVSFAAQGSAFRVGGVARATTSVVVPALAASPHFADVALFSPIERDEDSGAEQFDLTLALRRPGEGGGPR